MLTQAVWALLACCTLASTAQAKECVPSANNSYLIGWIDECTVVPPTNGQLLMPAQSGFYALTRAKLRGVATIGDVDLKFDHPGVDFGGIGNQYSYNDGVQSDASISMGRIDFVINGGIGAALQTSVAVPMTGTDANITVVSSYPSGNSSDSASWYGLLAGSTVNSGDRDPKLNHI